MSELNKIKVVDFTAGRLSSDDINTNIPFRDNLAKTRTIQQANAVIGAYVNRNYTDMQNKADKDEIPTKLSQLDNDVGYITEGDIPSKTSDLLNDGSDGEHPFITNQVDDLVNYTDNDTLSDEIGDIYGEINDTNTDVSNLQTAIDLQLPNRIGDIVVDSIRSKNMFNSSNVLLNTAISSGVIISDNNNDIFVIPVEISKTYTISKTSYNGGVLGFSNVYPKLGDTLTDRQSLANQGVITLTAVKNYLCLMIAHADNKNTIQVETGSTVTPYSKYQNLNPNFIEASSQSSVLAGEKYKFNNNFTIYVGTIVVGFTNGVANVDITNLHFTEKPYSVLATICSENYGIKYNFDSSSATSLRFELFNGSGGIYNKTGNVRFSAIISGITTN